MTIYRLAMQSDNLLIVGGDGQIGTALCNGYNAQGISPYTTTRRKKLAGGHRVYLDLNERLAFESIPMDSIESAVICAGISGLEECHGNPRQSSYVNVHQTRLLAEYLLARGKFLVFLSTNLVFDGATPFAAANSKPCPKTEYGRQKAISESQLLGLSDAVSIVRLSKVIGSSNTLFEFWKSNLRCGDGIKAYSDLYMAPVPMFTVTNAIKTIIKNKMAGIVQISAQQDISYYRAAQIGVESMKLQPSLVEKTQCQLLDGIYDAAARYTTLNTDVLTHDLNIDIPDSEWTVRKYFSNPELLI